MAVNPEGMVSAVLIPAAYPFPPIRLRKGCVLFQIVTTVDPPVGPEDTFLAWARNDRNAWRALYRRDLVPRARSETNPVFGCYDVYAADVLEEVELAIEELWSGAAGYSASDDDVTVAQNVYWVLYLATLAREQDAPVAVVDRDSALVAVDWLIERVGPTPLIMDAVVDLLAPAGAQFVVESYDEATDEWSRLQSGVRYGERHHRASGYHGTRHGARYHFFEWYGEGRGEPIESGYRIVPVEPEP